MRRLSELVQDIVDGQVENVVAVVQLNPLEGHARDVTEDIAQAVSERVCRDGEYPREAIRKFLDTYDLGYPSPKDTALFPKAMAPPLAEPTVSSLAEALERAQEIPKKPPANSVGGKTGHRAPQKARGETR